MSNDPEKVAAFVKSLTKEMLASCGPIFITPGLNTYPYQMIDNGTYALIDTAKKRLLVTCHHVWKAYLDVRGENPNAVLALNFGDGDASVAFAFPERQLVCADADLDLAVFDFEPSRVAHISHQKTWFRISEWPIETTKEGDFVSLMGFAGKEIKKEGLVCTFSTRVLPFRISGVGAKEIWIFNEPVNNEVFAFIRQSLGGLSGSPAYTRDKTGAKLVGFVRSGYKLEAPEETNADSIFAGTLILTPASFLQPDGSLRRPEI